MRKSTLILFFILCLAVVFPAQAQETLTLTTYYPSPIGIYDELRSRRLAIGDNYYDASNYPWDTDGLAPIGSSEIAQNADLVVEGNVGIGTTSPEGKLHVSDGQVIAGFVETSSAAIDWNQGNIQDTSASPGTITFTAGSMVNGTGYTLILSNSTGGNYTLSSADISNWRCDPNCPSNQVTVNAGIDTVVTMIRAGSTAYVSWIDDF